MKYSWGEPNPELIKDGKVLCPRCLKNEATIDPQFGVLNCKECANSSTTHLSSGKTENELIDYIATPLWQMAGKEPTTEEMATDNRLKAEGKTYGDAYRERLEKRGRVDRPISHIIP